MKHPISRNRPTLSDSAPSQDKDFRKKLAGIGIDIGLIVLASVLFFLAFPNVLTISGNLFACAFLALIPIFIVVHRCSWIRVFIYGAIYGSLTYLLFNYWLATFHPGSMLFVQVLYATHFLVYFPLLKLADTLFPDYGYILQAIIWIAYEYLRTQGFLGYAYGIIGYSQYFFLPLARVASFAGIWGVSFLVVFPQALIARAIRDGLGNCLDVLRRHIPIAVGYGALFIAAITYGIVSEVPLDHTEKWKVALIQQNSDPWKDSYEGYEATLDSLVSLSIESLAHDPDVVIWSETAFVPAIEYNLRYREVRDAVRVVQKLMGFLETQDRPYVTGNDEGVKIRAGTDREERIDYNSALLFNKSTLIRTYRKVHLVPFTEHFPYKEALPFIYDMLIRMDTHFWEKGDEYTVFESGSVRFSTPICFEDTFGYLCRRFVSRGADVLVNLTNDSWSGSVVAEMQHMAMAVFRAIENRRSVVRSTNSGITCAIDPNGKILSQIPPFKEAFLVEEVPVYRESVTLYGLWEDWFGIALTILAFCGLAWGVTRAVTAYARGQRGRKKD